MGRGEVIRVDRLFKELVEEEKDSFRKRFNLDISNTKATKMIADRLRKLEKNKGFIL